MAYKYLNTKHPGIFEYTTKTGNKYYRVRFSISVDGRREEVSKQGFKKISEARAYKQQIEQLSGTNDFELFKERKRTLKEHWYEFREIKIRNKKWNSDTLEVNDHRIKFWIDDFGDRRINTIDTDEIQDFIDDAYAEEEYSQATMHGFHRLLNQIMKDALNEGYIQRNPLTRVSYINKLEDWTPKNKLIQLNDFMEYMKTAKELLTTDLYCGVSLLAYGLRRGEVYGLRPKSFVFLDNGLTQINIDKARTSSYKDGKNVKSNSSNRVVMVDQETTDLIKETINVSKRIKMHHNTILHEDDFLLLSRHTGNPCKIKELNIAMKKVNDATGIDVTPHMLRHTFATHASALGVDSIQLQNFLGHADVKMTQHYSHGSIESAENVMRITERLRKNE